jgi:integrase
MSERQASEPRREGRIFPRGKKGILWIAWYDREGCEQRESTKSRDPRLADRRLRARLDAKDRGERYVPQARRATVAELLRTLRDHHEREGTKSWPRLRQCAAHLLECLGADTRAADINYGTLTKYVKARRRHASAGTVRMELWVLSQAYKIGRRHGLAGPRPEFPTVTVKNTRTVTFTDANLAALLAALPSPVRGVAEFASLTGWRLMECLDLRWARVDFEGRTIRLEPGETKNGRGRVFPFGSMPRLRDLLERQRRDRWRIERERGVVVEHVFHRDGRPIRDLDDAWRAACRRVELEGRHFHDLRRYAATRLVRAGVARTEAMALMGHETESMFVRYALNDLPMLERAVGKVAALDA